MSKVFIYTLLLLSCAIVRNKADAETGGLSWSTSTTGPWTTSTPNSWCDGFQPSVVSWRMDYDSGGPLGGFGSNPYRYTMTLYRNGTPIYSNTIQLSSYYVSLFDYNVPLVSGTYDLHIKAELRKITGWHTYSDHTWNQIVMNINECCPFSKTITGTWTTPLQESGSYIVSSGTTTVPSGANVKLDGTPGSYIQLNAGFEAQAGSVFVAQTYNGCTAGAPSIAPHDGTKKELPNVSEKNAADAFADDVGLVLYPNPTTGEFTIEHSADVKEILVFDLVGKLVLRVTPPEETVTKVDLSDQPQGTYLIKTDNSPVTRLVKQ